ncbi:SUMF1/EgtB/PvdO family nonheme iron enzyme [Shivajiella indica]|uniref:SUMF1/EgtB/PvdO family nonheme iron enzyme n=1 Tax=Shivajiella indica TaxID=872115 RepID=A0ABW5BAS5_9BACT
MTEQKALELLDLEPGATASEIRRAYQVIYNELQIRLTNAPTEHQKELYRKRLAAVEDAYIFFGGESEEDLSELPSMGPVEHLPEGKVQASKPQRVSESAALEILGLSKPFSKGRLLDAYKGKKEDFEKGLKVAPNNQIKTAFQKSLDDLENAFSLLETLVSSPPPKVETVKQSSPNKKASPLIWSIPVLIIIIAGIWFFTPKGEEQDEISQELRDEFIKAKSQADLLAEQQDWNQALEKYQEAYALLADTQVSDSIKSMEKRLALVASSTQKETEAKDWAATQKTNSTTGYLNFIKKYPSGTFTALAEQKIKELETDLRNKASVNTLKVPQETTAKTPNNIPLPNVLQELERNMVFIQGGIFTMGCTPEQSTDCDEDEKPTHRLTMDSFRLGKYEVTQSQWVSVMRSNPSKFKGCDNCPVENISWHDIQEFISNLNKITGKNYRLPSEAEWEYAARGGNQSQGNIYSGGNKLNDVAWNSGNSGNKTHQVGQKNPNELGLYDMSGNVHEWCNDWYEKKYYANSPEQNPKGPSNGSTRVRRGGSWDDVGYYNRVSDRFDVNPGNRVGTVGFRLAL